MAKVKHKFNDQLEDFVTDIIVKDEYTTSKQNQQADFDDFESYVDMFDNERTEKKYDWMSNIAIPEFSSRMITQNAMDAAPYFTTRDFVECYVMDPSQEAIDAADANEELINRTLNMRHLFYYQKYIRGKSISNLSGCVWLEAWWERDIKTDTVIRHITDTMEIGNGPLPEGVKGTEYSEEVKDIRKDRFNFGILDNRNVFTDDNYAYSAQGKEFIIVRSSTNIDKLYEEADRNAYFNLELIKADRDTNQTDEDMEIKNRDKNGRVKIPNMQSDNMTKLKRYGKFWIKNGKPGLDENGYPIDGAELRECIITVVTYGSAYYLIGFHETPYMDYTGAPYRPIIRGLCYIHPVDDCGAGDGKYCRELSIAINDTFNISNDRVMMATLPTLIAKKYVAEDTDSIFVEPGHVMMAVNPSEDIRELAIEDNITGAMNQVGTLKNSMNEVTSIFPGTMGNLPSEASTTATAVVGAEQRSTMRGNYKAMTFENTALQELYWMITQMTHQFAQEETGIKLMGDKVYNFNPSFDYFYKPLSQSIESEASKQLKINNFNQLIGYLTTAIQWAPEPMIKRIDYALNKITELMGDEYVNVMNMQTQPQDINMGEMGGGVGTPGSTEQVMSNQYQIPQSGQEAFARMKGG